jgi:Domain of unknown function (DUF4252)
MKFLRTTILLAVSSLTGIIARAQQPDWIPHGIETLGQQASSRTEFTLDRSMLVFAAKMDQDNEDLQRVIAGVNGVSVHSFRFPGPGLYDPSALVAIKEQYHAAGWNHLVSDHAKSGGASTTDLWIRFDKGAISNIAFLFAGDTQLNLVAVSGSISPLDLFHLSGHFGIPKMDGGAVVPVPENRR